MEQQNQQSVPEDALEQEQGSINSLDAISEGSKNEANANEEQPQADEPKPKKPNKIKDFFRRINVYLLFFLLLIIIAGAVFVVSYLNSRVETPPPTVSLEELAQSTAEELATIGEATIGDPSQILNVQSSAVFGGQVLIRGNANIAGNLQLGSTLSIPSLTVSGNSNLNDVQVNSLAVASSMMIQGDLTLQNDLNVSGNTTFNGNITAGRIAASELILSGTGVFEINNHIAANGPRPSTSNGGSIGTGGTSSVSGSDTAGTVNINTGSSTSAGCMATVNFVQEYRAQPTVVITPASADAARIQYYVTRTTSGFSVCSANAPLTGRALSYNYIVIE